MAATRAGSLRRLGMAPDCRDRSACARLAAGPNSYMISPMYRPAILFLVAACGPSASTIVAARDARYDVPFTTVWNVVVEEVRRRYPMIEVEDAISGQMITAWRVIETGGDPGNQT